MHLFHCISVMNINRFLRVLCVFLSLESDRGGFGMEEMKKRKAEEELEHYRQKTRAKQHNETRSLENFR